MTEEWRPVVGWEGLYEVSDMGRVRSVDRVITRTYANGLVVPVRLRGHLMKASNNVQTQYPILTLWRNNTQATRTVHSLVAEAFIGPRPAGHEVRHANDVRTDARAVNLSYGTSSDNHMDMVAAGRHWNGKKKVCKWGHKFTPETTRVYPTILKDGTPSTGRQCLTCKAERRPWPAAA